MKSVDAKIFWTIVSFIQEARNYAGGGYEPHSVDNSAVYYLNRSEGKIPAADTFVGDDGITIYRIDESVYAAYKKKFGYDL